MGASVENHPKIDGVHLDRHINNLLLEQYPEVHEYLARQIFAGSLMANELAKVIAAIGFAPLPEEEADAETKVA